MRTGAVLLLLLGAYALFVATTGYALPCPFRTITGWQCPGCGVTRMCMALLRLDIAAAYAANAALLCLLPGLALCTGVWLYRYIRTGERKLQHWQQLLLWGSIGVLLIHAVLRNQ